MTGAMTPQELATRLIQDRQAHAWRQQLEVGRISLREARQRSEVLSEIRALGQQCLDGWDECLESEELES